MGLYDNSPRAVPFLRPKITDGKDPEKAAPMAVPTGFKLLPELLAARGYRRHAVGKCAARARRPPPPPPLLS
eukprot:SAG22_NODE_72_length_22344_cov_95.586559_4_plen_72_part_00